MRELMALGVEGEALIAAVDRLLTAAREDGATTLAEAVNAAAEKADSALPSAAEKRRAWDREYRRKRKSGGIRVEGEVEVSGGKSGGIPPESKPLACVRDITSNLVDTGLVVVVDERESADDWPPGDARQHAQRLYTACHSHRLDPHKSALLVTSEGRLAAWKTAGASWRFDILPTVTEIVRKQGPPVATWDYFDKPVAKSIANNRRALEIPEYANANPGQPAKFRAKQDNFAASHAGFEAAARRSDGYG